MMWCSPAKPWGARSPDNSLFCLAETNIKSLPENKILTNWQIFISLFPGREGGSAGKSPSEKPVTTLHSALQPGLKMARKGSEPLPHSAVPHQPLSGRGGAVAWREVSRWATGWGEAAELTEHARLDSSDSAAAAPQEGEDGGSSVGQSARGAGSRSPVTQYQRSACPGRFHSPQSPPPDARVGGARPV